MQRRPLGHTAARLFLIRFRARVVRALSYSDRLGFRRRFAKTQFHLALKVPHHANARTDEFDGGRHDRTAEDRLLPDADGRTGRTGDQVSGGVLKRDVTQPEVGNSRVGRTLHHNAAHRYGHAAEIAVDLRLDLVAHEVERNRSLRQAHVEGHGRDQQNSKDGEDAESRYLEKPTHRSPSSNCFLRDGRRLGTCAHAPVLRRRMPQQRPWLQRWAKPWPLVRSAAKSATDLLAFAAC